MFDVGGFFILVDYLALKRTVFRWLHTVAKLLIVLGEAEFAFCLPFFPLRLLRLYAQVGGLIG